MKMRIISYFFRLIRAFVLLLNNISMRKKLVTVFFIFTAIPFGTYIAYSYIKSTSALENQTVYSEEKAFEQALSLIKYNVLNINRTMELIFMDETIQEVLHRCIQENYPTIDQVRDFSKLKEKIVDLEKSQDVGSIRIYIKNGMLFSDENTSFYDMDIAKKSVWFQKLHESSQNSLWCPPSYLLDSDVSIDRLTYLSDSDVSTRRRIANVRILKNPTNYDEDIGILRVDIDEQKIGKILTDAKVTPSSHVAIVNSDGDIVSCTKDFESSYSNILKKDLLEVLEEKDGLEHSWKGVLDKRDYLLQSSKVQSTDWILLSVTPYNDIINITNKLRNEMIVLLIGVVVLSYFMAYLISYTITKRISNLIKQMNRVKDGDLDIRTLQHGKDEVGQLSSTFNYMVLQMGHFIEEQNRMGKEIKSAEFKALQAQINPHFLYNTLELINWQAMKHNVPSVSSIVQTLAKFYKLSLSRGEEIITIMDEMELVRSYMQIQNMRFKDSIRLEEENMEPLYEYRIPKLILQPLVENAILHGIRTKKEASGTITVKGSFYEEGILIEVIDDGIGFTPQRLDEVKSGDYESKSTGNGYGLKNINKRLNLHYGDRFGLELDSCQNRGTHCYVRIPLIER